MLINSNNTTHLNFDSWVLAEPADEIKTSDGAKYITARSPSLYIRHPYHTDYQHHLGDLSNKINFLSLLNKTKISISKDDF